MQTLLVSFLHELEPRMGTLGTYEHVVLVAALAKLRFAPPPEWLTLFFKTTIGHLSACGPGNLTVLIRYAHVPATSC